MFKVYYSVYMYVHPPLCIMSNRKTSRKSVAKGRKETHFIIPKGSKALELRAQC